MLGASDSVRVRVRERRFMHVGITVHGVWIVFSDKDKTTKER